MNDGVVAVERDYTPQTHLGLGKISAIDKRRHRLLTLPFLAPRYDWTFTVRAVSRSNLLWGRRSKIIEAYAVTGDAREKFAFGRCAVDSVVLMRLVCRRVDRFPRWSPHGVHGTERMQNQFADVAATFKN